MDQPRLATRPTVPTVDVKAAHDREPDIVLLDVREADEWADGHAPGATHRPLGRLSLDGLALDRPVYVICRSGNRSAAAARALIDAGIDAFNVDGGMNAWVFAGLPVERG